MIERIRPKILVLLGLLLGCSSEDPEGSGAGALAQCTSDVYRAFDSANSENQRLRVRAYGEMVALMVAAEIEPFDADLAATQFAEARRLYGKTAGFQEKVRGRVDDHLLGPGGDIPAEAEIGAALDARIVRWLEAGGIARTALEAALARQWVDKSLLEFFYLSVYHEMIGGSAAKWDEAFGYLGAPVDDAPPDRRGLSALAGEGDALDGTRLARDIFGALVEGRCALDRALREAGRERVDWRGVEPLAASIERADAALQRVLARSLVREALRMAKWAPDWADPAQGEPWLGLAALDGTFRPIERLWLAEGGGAAADAAAIRAQLDSAWAEWAAGEAGPMADLDPQDIAGRVAARYDLELGG